MIKKIQLRVLLAWTVFLLALILFSVTIAFASDSKKDKDKNKDKQSHITIIKIVNGETVKIDTTFTVKSDEDAERIVKEITNRFDAGEDTSDIVVTAKGKSKSEKNKQVCIQLNLPHLSESERKKIREEVEKSIKEIEKSFDAADKSMKAMKFNFNISNDSDDVNIHFHIPPVPPDFSDDIEFFSDNELPDTLNRNEYVIIKADDGEEPPVFEKSVQGKSGDIYFIYKRKSNSKNKTDEKAELNIFPNPTPGKFTVSFNSEYRNDAVITVTTEGGKEVYRQFAQDVKGNYTIEIDLGLKANGRYIVSVQMGNIHLARKLSIAR